MKVLVKRTIKGHMTVSDCDSKLNTMFLNLLLNLLREYLESMCILAMQAYAELDRWDQALPFLLSCYGDISKLPPRIVLMW